MSKTVEQLHQDYLYAYYTAEASAAAADAAYAAYDADVAAYDAARKLWQDKLKEEKK